MESLEDSFVQAFSAILLERLEHTSNFDRLWRERRNGLERMNWQLL